MKKNCPFSKINCQIYFAKWTAMRTRPDLADKTFMWRLKSPFVWWEKTSFNSTRFCWKVSGLHHTCSHCSVAVINPVLTHFSSCSEGKQQLLLTGGLFCSYRSRISLCKNSTIETILLCQFLCMYNYQSRAKTEPAIGTDLELGAKFLLV